MGYSLSISDEASFDIIESHNWYYAISPKLSFEFENELELFLLLIQKSPNQFQLKYKNVRIVFLKRFPFGIHYLVSKKSILVIALFHTSKNPTNWSKRLKKK